MPARRARRDDDHRPLALWGSHWRADGAAKTAYPSAAVAAAAAHERALDGGVDLAVYRCDFCGHWHMGKAGGREED